MRYVFFRGKDLDTSEWVYGDLLHAIEYDPKTRQGKMTDGCIIYEKGEKDDGSVCRSVDVFPTSIGEYTGLKDKNGKQIFEGDIVTRYDNYFKTTEIGVVVFNGIDASFCISVEEYGLTVLYHFLPRVDYNDGHCLIQIKYTFEVIGNIHDNPELLKPKNGE